MNKVTILLRDIQLSQLNPECLKLVAKFVRQLKAHKGLSLRMQDADILLQISTQSHRTKNAELKALYVELKQEIQKSLHHSMLQR
jgi:hypothetical protein